MVTDYIVVETVALLQSRIGMEAVRAFIEDLQVVETAMSQRRPQLITRRGKNSAVLLSYDEYQKLVKPTKTLLEALRPDEPLGVDLEIVRDRDFGRDVELFSAGGGLKKKSA